MRLVLLGVGVCGALALLLILLHSQIRYRLGERHLRIYVLGICLRRIPLEKIDRASKRKRGMVENWSNVWRTKHKIVVLHRTGWGRPILITPPNRYIFIKELEAAQAKLGVHMEAAEDENGEA